MSFLVQWITNIIMFILLTVVMDMLLPNSSFKKYTKMVTGLLLITIILTPLLKLMSSNFEQVFNGAVIQDPAESEQVEKLIENKKKEIQASQRAYILKQMAVQLKKDAEEELIDQFGIGIQSVELVMQKDNEQNFPDNLEKVVVYLGEPQDDNHQNDIEAVKPITIDSSSDKDPKKTFKNENEVIDLLANRWNLDAQRIQIHYEGGISGKHES
ncbi:stage III sporulation protein AF [Falsibacillus pallidus]|uniref:Stage III sporulation protein AF n=1 Tax=Falsibacillus pallidus TaxID=493781 RepID=A0A370GDM1_9BACI|nr:stage III sporulation protein AF [Falsibacillus pallidus]RDI41189.1 stage III sporulation protein AF [Falsibacillus pallidus]